MTKALLDNASVRGESERNGISPAARDTLASETRAQPNEDRIARRAIRSFDVFDTLIARNCIEPRTIFARVEALTKHEDLARDRLAAEQRLSTRAYTLDDIYAELAAMRGWSPDQRDAVQAAEIFLEIGAVVPVAENLAQVQDGDIAVSDMYLPESVIRMLLKKAGLTKEIAVVVSSHGKRSGEVWPQLLASYHIEQHIGDNPLADVQSPQRFGITSRRSTVALPDAVETWLIGNGMRDIAQIIRQARLSSWTEDATCRQLQLIQTRFNFPILTLSSILLARHVARNGADNVLFCSRDCNLWQDLFALVAKQLGLAAGEQYFYTSRQARIKPSADYRRYAREALAAKAIVVDVCGTGWSLSHLMQSIGVEAPVYFIARVPKMDVYEKIRPTAAHAAVHAITDSAGNSNEYLEMCNYAAHPQIVDVSYVHDRPHPVFAVERRPPAILAAVREQQKIFRQTLAICEAQGLEESLMLPDEALRAAVAELCQSLRTQNLLPAVYAAMHAEEETEQMRVLGRLA